MWSKIFRPSADDSNVERKNEQINDIIKRIKENQLCEKYNTYNVIKDFQHGNNINAAEKLR